MDTDISSYEKPVSELRVDLEYTSPRLTSTIKRYQLCCELCKCVIAAQLLKRHNNNIIVEYHFLFRESCRFLVAIFRKWLFALRCDFYWQHSHILYVLHYLRIRGYLPIIMLLWNFFLFYAEKRLPITTTTSPKWPAWCVDGVVCEYTEHDLLLILLCI